MLSCEVLVIGGGSAGLAAAQSAVKHGARSVMVIERDEILGGILQQCIHNGFGLHRFGEELTGPEYALKDIEATRLHPEIQLFTETSVLSCDAEKLQVKVVGPEIGLEDIQAKSIVFACGCKERTRGAIGLAGSRPTGVFTAGSAQRLVNCNGQLVGKRVLILGSGDIGLIMARRMLYEGAEVLCVCELMDHPGGLRRNIVQCLEDYGIELKLSTTVVEVHGYPRLEAVTIAEVDPKTYAPKMETAQRVECDALLLSVGLIPENGLASKAGLQMDPRTQGPVVDQHLMSSHPGVFCCGNQLHVHDLVDFVSEEGMLAGKSAARFALNQHHIDPDQCFEVASGFGIGNVTPHKIVKTYGEQEPIVLRFRSNISAKHACIVLKEGEQLIKKKKAMVIIPSEMMSIELKPEEYADLNGNIELSLELSEDDK